MNALEKAVEQSVITKRVCSEVRKALGQHLDGTNDTRNDKHRLYVGPERPILANGDWSPAQLLLFASYGYYGSSSGYNAMDKDVARYLVKSINHHMPAIAETAMHYALADEKTAKEAAREMAQEILRTT